MNKATLVIMAAGLGSRYGDGIKQLEVVGANGEIIMDYSIYDALEAGFDKVVFVIRKNIETEFKEVIGNRISKIVDVKYVYQETDILPESFKDKAKNRRKPWGTGQAILCCRDVVKEPFLVINADDYYGKEAYREAYKYLTMQRGDSQIMKLCMVGFVLGNTLSENGTVTRGICKVDEESMLTEIEETYGIRRQGNVAKAVKDDREIELPLDSAVSMNMWGIPKEFISLLEEGFENFLKEISEEDLESEYLLPRIIGNMLKEGKISVKVLTSKDKWFGVTYKEDKSLVVQSIYELVEAGVYPRKLF